MLAPVAAGIGFTLLTPTMLIDRLEIETHKLCIAGFACEITTVARERELGELPAGSFGCTDQARAAAL